MLHKKKPLTIKMRQIHIYNVSLLLKKAIIGIFYYLHNYVKPGAKAKSNKKQ